MASQGRRLACRPRPSTCPRSTTGIHADFASKSILEHNELTGSVLGGGALYPPK